MDWGEVLPPEDCSYVLGNPPFGGAKFQSPEQRAQVRRIAALGGSWRDARLRDRLVHHRGRETSGRAGPPGKRGQHRIRRHQLDHPRRAGGAALADPVWPLRTGDRVRAPDVRLGFGCAGDGACACGDYRIGEAGRCAQREAALLLRRSEGRTAREQACGAFAVSVRCGWVGGSEGGGEGVGNPADEWVAETHHRLEAHGWRESTSSRSDERDAFLARKNQAPNRTCGLLWEAGSFCREVNAGYCHWHDASPTRTADGCRMSESAGSAVREYRLASKSKPNQSVLRITPTALSCEPSVPDCTVFGGAGSEFRTKRIYPHRLAGTAK